MFENCHYPESLQPDQLDLYLSKGWFRMGQSIFTTSFVLFDEKVYPTVWLRHTLNSYSESKTIKNLKKRNKQFDVECKRACITPEHESLFQLYRQSMQFDTAPSLDQLLNGYVFIPCSIYNTYEINIYDGDELIACSYFDVGDKAAEGISAFYNPKYRNHSLGRYMIYLQIELCKFSEFEYYYPGYFVPGFSHLDYKLGIGTEHLEFLNQEDMLWYPIQEFEDKGVPIEFQDYFIQ